MYSLRTTIYKKNLNIEETIHIFGGTASCMYKYYNY